ncbi:ABC transporter ATP-binding protein [Rhodococcus rhodochrous]|uniref:ABC transporter ATP-binding protein n=1 Tax=Rhodococcus rhodochrous TaxID=1829 RepID=UPI001E3A8D33|nr:ABC transporter ATP-binding protein [Rhodococcus rhodochrous]MCD2097067.1 ABC transporter ATP-binding protein [Rhodococcus rhodochrous]MCD2120501.1 ABC transporter ATP-binding protein [Rhodococcus rhodochrous]MCQ4137106.1 ABC transporter ATP-binding protein [Rhodococcus rhodochrous]MDJ0017366.1 ABC transporter ATP-binding protein [Rhodococcus rhodochrous]
MLETATRHEPHTEPPQRAPLIEVENLTVRYGRARSGAPVALDGVSLEILEGEVLGVVGESGSGKSTLGKALLGLAPVVGGTITYRGRRIESLSPPQMREFHREMQMIFQDPFGSLNPRMTVREIVAAPLRNFGIMERDRIDGYVEDLLGQVGISKALLDRYPVQFSGGQRQRVGIARALAVSPRFVVADEPVSALDVSIQAQVVNLLVDLQKERNLTMMFVSHDMGVVRHIADRVCVVYLGRIVEIAPADEFFDEPLHPYSRMLLDAVPGNSGAAGDPDRDVPSIPRTATGCRFANICPVSDPMCREVAPSLAERKDGRAVRCHFPDSLSA